MSCGGIRQERPPIVLENILSCIDTLWGAGSSSGALLLQQQPLASSRLRSSICDTVLASHALAHSARGMQEWHNQKEAVKALLDDSPAAPDLAQVQDPQLLWAGRAAPSLCRGVCCVCIVSPRTRLGPLWRAHGLGVLLPCCHTCTILVHARRRAGLPVPCLALSIHSSTVYTVLDSHMHSYCTRIRDTGGHADTETLPPIHWWTRLH